MGVKDMKATGKGKDVVQHEYSGTKVPLKFRHGIGVTQTQIFEYVVFPMGLAHIQKFSSAIGRATSRFIGIGGLPSLGEDGRLQFDATKMSVAIALVVEIITQDLMELVLACVHPPEDGPPVSSLAHWHLPPIIEAWILENFGSEDQLHPWIQVMERTILRVTGKRVSIWEPLCKHLSPAAIRARIFSAEGSEESTESNSPTSDGPSPKSGDGTNSPSDGSDTKEPIQ